MQDEEQKAANIPDGEGDWTIGSETFTRQEVFKILYSQRAMIENDIKRSGEYENLSESVVNILANPRKPII